MNEFISIKELQPNKLKQCLVMDKNGIIAYAEPCFQDFKFIPCTPTKENKWMKDEIVWLDNPSFIGWLIEVIESFGTLNCPMGDIIKWKYV